MTISPEETNDPSKPALPDFANRQLELFQKFLFNTDTERDRLSNAIDLWDSVPRYATSRQEMTKSRVNGVFLEPRSIDFQHRGKSYICTIQPAYVTDLDGKGRYFYPSASEELVEDALRKLAIEQQAGYFDRANYRSGVVFSLHALREEMSRRGHTRSYQQIVQSLNILSHCVVDIIPQTEGEARLTSACLPSLAAVSRKRLKDDPEAKWAVTFHPLVTAAIDKVTHRQFNYGLMMGHSSQLARWLHKQLVLKYTFADFQKPFQMRYSTVRRDSGLLEAYARDRDAVEALAEAFKTLEERGVIGGFKREDERGPRRKLLDVIFTLRPSLEFIRETKASNKRQSDLRESVQQDALRRRPIRSRQ